MSTSKERATVECHSDDGRHLRISDLDYRSPGGGFGGSPICARDGDLAGRRWKAERSGGTSYRQVVLSAPRCRTIPPEGGRRQERACPPGRHPQTPPSLAPVLGLARPEARSNPSPTVRPRTT